MPLDISLGSGIENRRRNSIDNAASLTNYLYTLKPHCYILHLNLPKSEERDIRAWQDRINGSLSRIFRKAECNSREIAIENLDYPFSYVEDIVVNNNLSICIDIGHLINVKVDVEKHIDRYLNKTSVIHLHGVNKNKDHLSLKHLDKRLIKHILQLLKESNYQGVLTLEVFSQHDFEESLSVFNKYL